MQWILQLHCAHSHVSFSSSGLAGCASDLCTWSLTRVDAGGFEVSISLLHSARGYWNPRWLSLQHPSRAVVQRLVDLMCKIVQHSRKCLSLTQPNRT